MYRISYLYNGVFGLLGTLIIGVIVSYVVNLLEGGRERVYDPNLFIPPLARRMKKHWDKPQDMKEVPFEFLTPVKYLKRFFFLQITEVNLDKNHTTIL